MENIFNSRDKKKLNFNNVKIIIIIKKLNNSTNNKQILFLKYY